MFKLNKTNFAAVTFLSISIAAPLNAFAQDEEEIQQAIAGSKVRKQNGCSLMVKNDSKLKIKQKVTVTSTNEDLGSGVVRSTNPNGTAIVILEQKSCQISFLGGDVVADSQGSDSDNEFARAPKSRLPAGVVENSSAHNRLKYPLTAELASATCSRQG